MTFNAKGPAAAPMTELIRLAMSEGLYLSSFSNVVRLTPPLNISREDIDFACEVLDRTFDLADRHVTA